MTILNISELFSKKSSLGSEFIWVVISQIAALVGSLITIKLLSNILSHSEFGIYTLLFSIPSLLVSTFFISAGQINMRFLVISQEQGEVREFYQDQKRILLFLSLIALIFLIPAIFLLKQQPFLWITLYSTLALLTLVMGYQTAQQFLLMAFRLRTEASTAQIIGAISRPLAVFLVIWSLGYNALSAIIGLIIGFAILSLSQYIFLRKSWHEALLLSDRKVCNESEEDYLTLKNYISYGSFHIILGLVTVIVLIADRWILYFSGTLEQVAIYASLMQIALAPTAFGYAIIIRMAAPLYFKTRDQPVATQNRYFLILLVFWAMLAIGMLLVSWLFHGFIVALVTNATFAQYSYLLPWMVLGMIFERTAQVLEMKGALHLKTKPYLFPRIALIILIPALEYLCFRLYGFDGLVYGLIAATFLSLCAILVINQFSFKAR